jgi:hypothetical protein
LGTVPEAMLYGRADDRYVWFSSQTQGGFYRFDTMQQNSSSSLGRPLGGFDLVGSVLYYTNTSSPNYVFEGLEGNFQGSPSWYHLWSTVAPDTVAGGVASSAANSVFLTSAQPNEGVTVRYVGYTAGSNAVITTIPKTTVGTVAVVGTTQVRMDATNVFVAENAVGQIQQGRVLYVAKSTRNGTGANQLSAYNSKVRDFEVDSNALYIGLQDGRLVRQPKP